MEKSNYIRDGQGRMVLRPHFPGALERRVAAMTIDVYDYEGGSSGLAELVRQVFVCLAAAPPTTPWGITVHRPQWGEGPAFIRIYCGATQDAATVAALAPRGFEHFYAPDAVDGEVLSLRRQMAENADPGFAVRRCSASLYGMLGRLHHGGLGEELFRTKVSMVPPELVQRRALSQTSSMNPQRLHVQGWGWVEDETPNNL